jgi:hypothetical protein
MNNEHLFHIAKQAAVTCTERHDYMPLAMTDEWAPHQWVIDAMSAAADSDIPKIDARPVQLSVVGVLRDDDDGGLEAHWTLEGGTAELFEGDFLLVADRDIHINGHAEVYPHPPAGAAEQLRKVERSLDELRRSTAELIGAPADTWPSHGNAPLAIAAALALRVLENDTLRAELAKRDALLLWALYHHQGGKSDIGQPIRRLLGIGQHDDLTDEQIQLAAIAAGRPRT